MTEEERLLEDESADQEEQSFEEESSVQEEPSAEPKSRRQLHLWASFKNVAILFSFVVNLVLVLVLLLAIRPIFMAKNQIAEPLLGNLDSAFAALGETNIKTTVQIDDQLPVAFNLPLEQDTTVVLQEAVRLVVPATYRFPGGGGAIHGQVDLELPVGLELPVALDLDVPVSTTVPVEMSVPVVINLNQAGMGPAIEQLRGVFQPIDATLQQLPDSPSEVVSPK